MTRIDWRAGTKKTRKVDLKPYSEASTSSSTTPAKVSVAGRREQMFLSTSRWAMLVIYRVDTKVFLACLNLPPPFPPPSGPLG
jgi:hypothetical protein